ncbi:MAG: hypothetical protein KDK71_08875, partial [Chlamydiia bacterium]|nr:hypothetical protein [Chlamydiia bacterium]
MFCKRKFFSLTVRQQHKHAGLYLRSLYEKNASLDAQYRAMEEWLSLSPLAETKEEIIDRFHEHMNRGA